MKRFISENKALILVITFVVAFVCGLVGLLSAYNMPISDAVFQTILMFMLEYSDPAANVLIDIARYLAAGFTIAGAYVLLSEFFAGLRYLTYSRFNDSVYIFGKSPEAESLAAAVGKHVIFGTKQFRKSTTYLLMADENDNISFYNKYAGKLADKEVYIKSDSIGRVITNGGRHVFFSVDELAARKYWLENDLMTESFRGTESKHHARDLSIAMIGFNRLTEELLFEATQANVYAIDQVITYHVYGDTKAFSHLQFNLDQLHIVCHEEDWTEDIDRLRTVDRIIICDMNHAIESLQQVLKVVSSVRVDVFCRDLLDTDILKDHRYGKIVDSVSINPIDYDSGTLIWHSLHNEPLIEQAQALNWVWWGKPEDKTKEELWTQLSSETRRSNLASVDHQLIRDKLLELWNEEAGEERSWEFYKEEMAELEHIRWMNYYLYNNWRQSSEFTPDKPGSTKSTKYRLHMDMIPYAELSEEEKEKDRVQLEKLFEARESI